MFLTVSIPRDYERHPWKNRCAEFLISADSPHEKFDFSEGEPRWLEMLDVFRSSYLLVCVAGGDADDGGHSTALASMAMLRRAAELPQGTRNYIGHFPVEASFGRVMVAFTANAVPRNRISPDEIAKILVPDDPTRAADLSEQVAKLGVVMSPTLDLPEETWEGYYRKIGIAFCEFFGINNGGDR